MPLNLISLDFCWNTIIQWMPNANINLNIWVFNINVNRKEPFVQESPISMSTYVRLQLSNAWSMVSCVQCPVHSQSIKCFRINISQILVLVDFDFGIEYFKIRIDRIKLDCFCLTILKCGKIELWNKLMRLSLNFKWSTKKRRNDVIYRTRFNKTTVLHNNYILKSFCLMGSQAKF